MNPMIAALQKSRAAGPAVEVEEIAEEAAPENPGDALISKLEAIEAKLDKLCSAMNVAGDESEGDASPAPEAKEVVPNDDGY